MKKTKIAIIGGSGFYNLENFKETDSFFPKTPWGYPSDPIRIGKFLNHRICFLSRHGKGHRILPTEVPSKANISALKMLGVERIYSFSAVGSLREELKPLDFVIPNQIIDRTRLRDSTFFGNGVVAHFSFADPFSKNIANEIKNLEKKVSFTIHFDKTLICMEGPAFSTRAESEFYRLIHGDIINMSVLPEAKLAKEAEIDYQMICMVTDYDCWKIEEKPVTTEMVIANLNRNVENAKFLLKEILSNIDVEPLSSLKNTISQSIITDKKLIPKKTAKKLKVIYPDFFK